MHPPHAQLPPLVDSLPAIPFVEPETIERQRSKPFDLRLDLMSIASATNFVTIDLGADGERARAALQALEARGVFERMPGVAPMDRCIRVTVGLPEEHAQSAEVFASAPRTFGGA